MSGARPPRTFAVNGGAIRDQREPNSKAPVVTFGVGVTQSSRV